MFMTLAACGGEEKRPETASAPVASTTASSVGSSAPPAASASASAAASVAPPAPAQPKGKVTSFAVAATSGKVDKVGNKDGAFTPDGVKDLVFDAEVEGPAVAIAIVSANGSFIADTYSGDEGAPPEVQATVKPGKMTAGVAVYEGGKLLNATNGGLNALSDGKHKLVLHISSKDAPKGAFKAFAIFDNKTVAASEPTAAN